MKDKQIAENVIRNWIQDEHLPRVRMILSTDEICELMQAYFKAKLRESKIIESFERENNYVTDEDIEAWADKKYPCYEDYIGPYVIPKNIAFIEGAKAMRDGEIKCNREV